MQTIDDLLDLLASNDGACLYWQLPNANIVATALALNAVYMDGDLVVHPDAHMVEQGMAYTMKGSKP